MTRKGESQKIRESEDKVFFDIRVIMSVERKADLIAHKRASMNTWETIITKGIAACMDERADINDAIFCNAYVKCYKTKSYKHVVKRRAGSRYEEIYLYWLSAASGKKLNVYFSVGEPLTYETRHEVQHWRMSRNYFHEDILNEFNFGSEGVIAK